MAKNGQKVDDLYLSIGLDVDQLQLDFDTAGKTVNQTMSRLNSEIKQLKIKTSIDMSKLDGAGTAVDKVRVKEQALTRELQLQTQKMNILTAAYKSAQGQYGNDSGITRKAETSLLGQQAAVEKLKASIRGLAAEESKIGVGSTGLAKITAGASAARAGLTKVSEGYTMLSGKMMAFAAFATTGAGLFTITDSAMNAGESLYKLKTRLHTSTEEAAQLSRVFQISGTDINSVIPLFARLDKQFMSAGVDGNGLTLAMQQFGISLTDSAGNLLPISQQLDQLAKGYQKAAESGNEEAYTADVLGAKGAALVPLLQDYVTNMAIANQVQTTGLLNPNDAHKLYIQWQVMKAEGGQLGTALGAALMPVAQDVMPEVTNGMKELITEIRANKDDIKAGIEGWGSALKGVADSASAVIKPIEYVGELIGKVNNEKKYWSNQFSDAFPRVNDIMDRVGLSPTGFKFEALGTHAYEHIKDYMNGKNTYNAESDFNKGLVSKMSNQQSIGDFSEFNEVLKTRKTALQEATDAMYKASGADKVGAESAKQNGQAQYMASKMLEERRAMTKALTEDIYNLTHSDLDNSLHAMQKTIKEARDKGVDEGTLAEYSSVKSAKIYQQFAESVTQPMAQAFRTDLENQFADIDQQAQHYIDQGASTGAAERWAAQRKSKITAEWDRQVAEQIDSVWHSEYQNQLTRIENERQAWIQKGLDEVKAAEWAEEQKKQIQQRTAVEAFTTQKKYLEIYRNAIAAGQGQQGAAMQIAQQMRKDKGIPDDAYTSPGELAGFEEAMKSAQDHLVPVLSDSVYAGVKRAMIEVQRGTNVNYELPDDMKQKLIPREYQNYMPINVIPTPQYMPARGHENDTTRQGAGGDITVKVNIDRPYVNDDKALTQLADNVSKKIIDVTQQGQYKY